MWPSMSAPRRSAGDNATASSIRAKAAFSTSVGSPVGIKSSGNTRARTSAAVVTFMPNIGSMLGAVTLGTVRLTRTRAFAIVRCA